MSWLRQIADRPIGESERRGAFLAAASVLILAAVVLLVLPAGHKGDEDSDLSVAVSREIVPAEIPRPTAAELAARRFVDDYLRFAYGHGDSKSIASVTPALLAKLIESHGRVTPAAKTRDARVSDLDVRNVAAGRAAATSTVEVDGVSFPITMKLAVRNGLWLVESVGAD